MVQYVCLLLMFCVVCVWNVVEMSVNECLILLFMSVVMVFMLIGLMMLILFVLVHMCCECDDNVGCV